MKQDKIVFDGLQMEHDIQNGTIILNGDLVRLMELSEKLINKGISSTLYGNTGGRDYLVVKLKDLKESV